MNLLEYRGQWFNPDRIIKIFASFNTKTNHYMIIKFCDHTEIYGPGRKTEQEAQTDVRETALWINREYD